MYDFIVMFYNLNSWPIPFASCTHTCTTTHNSLSRWVAGSFSIKMISWITDFGMQSNIVMPRIFCHKLCHWIIIWIQDISTWLEYVSLQQFKDDTYSVSKARCLNIYLLHSHINSFYENFFLNWNWWNQMAVSHSQWLKDVYFNENYRWNSTKKFLNNFRTAERNNSNNCFAVLGNL